ncbi:uncharacterized protein [Drosophila pseudoobscura]|uniref:Uncharacterized protein isoform X3 n=1 Tax=Drosophila pseudoobscura pseudoobscura TaxID=46245 RepID=A0A6I8V739_DROPS|nr:uncharacterized protein LOC6902943 isoform X3 [Drosophila pseudoobscura]XP_033236412.1 uncharacterized protein LOC6902943 isoform X5 [Drosophila pseudoobscura]
MILGRDRGLNEKLDAQNVLNASLEWRRIRGSFGYPQASLWRGRVQQLGERVCAIRLICCHQ